MAHPASIDPATPTATATPDRRVVVRGVGLISPLGHSAWSTFTALLQGRTLADRSRDLPSGLDPVTLVRSLGSVSTTVHAGVDPSLTLAEAAARQAMCEAGVDQWGKGDPGDQTASQLGTGLGADMPTWLGVSKGAMRDLCRLLDRHASGGVVEDGGIDQPLMNVVTQGPAGYLADRLRHRLALGVVQPVVAACASSLTALHLARQHLMHHPGARRALVVTSEAALMPMFINSYARLGVLAPLGAGRYRGRPLDQQRCGFMLAELGAAVVLEVVDTPPAAAWTELVQTGIACEAHDLVRTAPGMPALAHLAGRLLADRQVDVLHPHATGTQEHDHAELAVYQQVVSGSQRRGGGAATAGGQVTGSGATASGADEVDVYACKGALGHGLGSAGLVSLVLACLMARTGRIPPMPWLDQPLDAGPLRITAQSRPVAGPTHAIFAAGFGGHTAGSILQHHP